MLPPDAVGELEGSKAIPSSPIYVALLWLTVNDAQFCTVPAPFEIVTLLIEPVCSATKRDPSGANAICIGELKPEMLSDASCTMVTEPTIVKVCDPVAPETVIVAVPAVPMSDAGTIAVSCVELTNVVES